MTYYWVVPMTTTKDGRPKAYLVEGDRFFSSEGLAESYAGELAMDSEICPTTTTNRKQARRELRLYLAKKYAKEKGDFSLGTANAQWKDEDD